MTTRRTALKLLVSVCTGLFASVGRLGTGFRLVFAETTRLVLPKGTPLQALITRNPAALDTHNLDVTPLDEFGTMGQTRYRISLADWRLNVDGAVDQPLRLTYTNLIARPAIERNVLLICPGFFAYLGHWRGVSAAGLLAEAKVRPEVTQVEFSGPKGWGGINQRFSIDEVDSDRVFLAYQVNGTPLPQKHGFPLRLVAEGHYGTRWVKYVDKITAVSD